MNSETNSQNQADGTISEISFSDIFNLAEIQQLQDLFSDATGVASQITQPDGTPISRTGNFSRFSGDIFRKTKKKAVNCHISDEANGCKNSSDMVIQLYLS